MQKTSDYYRPDIDCLRAIAVLSVLFFHLKFTPFSGGFVGVDIFFVISGYLITRLIYVEISETKKFKYSDFYIRRVRRLFPALFFTLLLCFLLAFLLFSPMHFQRFSGALFHVLLGVPNVYFWQESGYFDVHAIFKPLLHTWSLGVEEQFYLVWPLLLALLLKKNNRPFTIVVFLTLAAFSLLSAYQLETKTSLTFFLTPFRIYEFCIGAFLVWAEKHELKKNYVKEIILILGLGLVVGGVLAFDKNTYFPSYRALIPCVGTAMIIYAGSANHVGKLFRIRALVFIGLRSYSLYLIHWPIIVFYSYLKGVPLSLFEKWTIVASSLALASIMYSYIELPYRYRLSKGRYVDNKAVASRCGLLAAALLSITCSSWVNAGWQWRIETDHSYKASDLLKLNLKLNDDRTIFCPGWRDVPVGRFCSVGMIDDAPAEVLLIGDSHAEALSPGLDYLGKEIHKKIDVWSFPGCPPIWNTYKIYGTSARKPRQKQCKEIIQKWEKYVKRTNYRFVILAARWAMLFEPEQYGGMILSRDYLVDAKNPIQDVKIARELFRSRLRETVTAILKTGKKVILFSQIPLLARDIGECGNVPSYLFSTAAIRRRCDSGVTVEEERNRLKYTDALIKSLASRDVLDIIASDYMCDESTCRTIVQDTVMYRDTNHLSGRGSVVLAEEYKSLLSAFLEKQ
jgi:peptidoglycan/LPS O-acetylase OafA/YrhL